MKYVVINPDGTYAGVLCDTYDEAIDLASQKKGRVIGEVCACQSVKVAHFHCPVNGWDCPYWTNGVCGLDNPIAECDDFAAMWGEDADPTEYTCYGDSGCDVWEMGK